ncbi:40S ribosomal protein S13 [Acorus calamus]|uniref:Maspardin n=1 Tax=Acorus calamus TaxID=4465 RepID=A0AAV9C749_ACOCL|nr:40S ribosomal protein S13 [Acorus calamus]
MKGVASAPGDYIHFKSLVPLHQISVGLKQWRYYDFGPKAVPPLVCLPGIAGTADVYYKQILSLSMKGYRVVSVDIPRVRNHHEWIQAFEKFLDTLNVHHVHLYGTSLGGFLAQLFAQHRPRRVKSLVLSNSFLETHKFSAAMPWSPIVNWTPSFLLKRYILTGIRDGPHEPFIADSVDFVVGQVEKLSREDVSSRLTLNVDATSVGSLLLPDSFITIMDTNDYCAIPQQLKDEVIERYPGARKAILKTGGDFPFLSRPDEVNLYLQLHLRRVGVEAHPDLVKGTSKDDNEGSPSGKDGREDIDDLPENTGGSQADDKDQHQSNLEPEIDEEFLGNTGMQASESVFSTYSQPFPLTARQNSITIIEAEGDLLLGPTLQADPPKLAQDLHPRRPSLNPVEEQICKLAKKGTTPSQIGVVLRDSNGIAQVKSVTGSKILRILKANGLAPEIPEDLYHLIKKAVAIRKHLERNRKDKDSKFRLILVESRIHRLARYYKRTKKLPPVWK